MDGGGLETKVFAYAFAILSLSSFLSEKYQKGLLFAGLSLSFHLLVGIYNLFCLIPIFLFLQRETKSFLKKIFKSLPIFLLASGLGIYVIVYQFFIIEEDISNLGWNIYVNIRVPHHTSPDFFPYKTWIKMTIFTVLNIGLFFKSKKQKVKLISCYSLFSVIISLVGLIIFFVIGTSHHLKYYFFRFSDIMLPLVTLLNVASFIIENIEKLIPKRKKQLKYIIVVISLFFLFPKINYFLSDATTSLITKINYFLSEATTSLKQIKAATTDDIIMSNWVKNNTETNSVFITQPDDKYFYINYERPMFVSWKHSPQSASDIVEWYNRLKFLNRNEEFQNLRQVKQCYYSLTEEDILAITEAYSNIDYFLTYNSIKLNFPILFKSRKYTLYDVRNVANKK